MTPEMKAFGGRRVSGARKVSVRAAANIAFVKYWGAREVAAGLPFNSSISMTLSRCTSHCTAEFDPEADRDEVYEAGERGELRPPPAGWTAPVLAHLDRIRRWAGVQGAFRIATRNSFPAGAGLASSASGFAALTVAAAGATARDADPADLSDLARQSGSGSAARSVLGGYVEWPADLGEVEAGRAPARRLHGPRHWDLRDVVALVETGPKAVSSREGHERVPTSPYFEARLALLPARLDGARRAVENKDFDALRTVLEEEAVDLHFLAMTARPPFFYWTPATLEVVGAVRDLGASGVDAAWTMDAGANVHVICSASAERPVVERLRTLSGVRSLIRDRVGPGPVETDDHLL
ncbi:MAG: diphosphomevalonate decarboxylase [Gemmatimonadota bacterium]